ncbi:hypothetical protein [Dictyobacter arantiisoli]|nr:hypothetical protein [Dictyobacter arantiisoli]
MDNEDQQQSLSQFQREFYRAPDPSGSNDRPSLTAEQLREIHQVKAQATPWLYYYLMNHPTINENEVAERIVIKINETFEKEARESPRQHVSQLVRLSIDQVKDTYRQDTEQWTQADKIDGLIKKIWSGDERQELREQFNKNQQEIDAIDHTLNNWSGNLLGYRNNSLGAEREKLQKEQKRIQRGITRLDKMDTIAPPEELPPYEE